MLAPAGEFQLTIPQQCSPLTVRPAANRLLAVIPAMGVRRTQPRTEDGSRSEILAPLTPFTIFSTSVSLPLAARITKRRALLARSRSSRAPSSTTVGWRRLRPLSRTLKVNQIGASAIQLLLRPCHSCPRLQWLRTLIRHCTRGCRQHHGELRCQLCVSLRDLASTTMPVLPVLIPVFALTDTLINAKHPIRIPDSVLGTGLSTRSDSIDHPHRT